MGIAPSAAVYRQPKPNPSLVNGGISGQQLPPRYPSNTNGPVDAISSTPGSRSGSSNSGFGTVVGQPKDQSGVSARKLNFITTNSSSGGGGLLSAAQKQSNLDAVGARKSGVLGCLGKSPGTTPGCNNPCDTVNCLTTMLTGNLLDLDAKKLLCDVASSTERSLKRQIDSTGDQLLNAALTLTSLNPVIAPLSALQGFVNKIDPGQVANCFGAQALKDKVNGKFNQAKNTVKKFQKGYQDKIAAGFNKATAAAQQFSITPNLCASPSPASLRSLLG